MSHSIQPPPPCHESFPTRGLEFLYPLWGVGHQGRADPSLPWALFPILNPLIGRKFSLASNLNPSCATTLCQYAHTLCSGTGKPALSPRHNDHSKFPSQPLFLDANTCVPLFGPWLKMIIALDTLQLLTLTQLPQLSGDPRLCRCPSHPPQISQL